MLALFVLSLVIIDLIILLTYTISQGVLTNLSSERVPNKENPEDRKGVSVWTGKGHHNHLATHLLIFSCLVLYLGPSAMGTISKNFTPRSPFPLTSTPPLSSPSISYTPSLGDIAISLFLRQAG